MNVSKLPIKNLFVFIALISWISAQSQIKGIKYSTDKPWGISEMEFLLSNKDSIVGDYMSENDFAQIKTIVVEKTDINFISYVFEIKYRFVSNKLVRIVYNFPVENYEASYTEFKSIKLLKLFKKKYGNPKVIKEKVYTIQVDEYKVSPEFSPFYRNVKIPQKTVNCFDYEYVWELDDCKIFYGFSNDYYDNRVYLEYSTGEEEKFLQLQREKSEIEAKKREDEFLNGL